MSRSLASSVIVLALFASTLTRPAAADPAPDAPAPQAEGTPLPVRPSAPLTLAPAPASPGLGWKLFALAAAAGCGAWMWKKRAAKPVSDKRIPELRILGRTVAGPRCELLLIELDGQRLLLGVTPQSIQNLYIVADPPAETREEPPVEAPPAASKKTPRNGVPEASPIEGQVRGLFGPGDRS